MPEVMKELTIAELDGRPVVMLPHALKRLQERAPRRANLPLPHKVRAWLNFASSLLCSSQELLAEYHEERDRNNGQAALYYYNERANLRFVLVPEGEWIKVVTVERPYERVMVPAN